MIPKRIMIIAGEPSGDLLAAELVTELRLLLKDRGCQTELFGAGGPKMKAAGVDLAFDMTANAVVGLVEVLRNLGKFRQLFRELLAVAVNRRPDAVVCVDFSGFNRRFAHALRRAARNQPGWSPTIIQYVSPQVWASREGRARKMARDYNLLLAIFPFEPEWYARRAPALKVEFVGHPILDRYATWRDAIARKPVAPSDPARILLLPGSRIGELKRHLPVLLGAASLIAAQHRATFQMVLPTQPLLDFARTLLPSHPPITLQAHGLPEALAEADLALASTGTVTMECAFFKVPTVAFYKTSWSTYQIARRIVKVKYLAMPNLLAGETIFPEFVQDQATAENIARSALSLLQDHSRRQTIRDQLDRVIASLGQPGASRRAAHAISTLVVPADSSPA